MVRMVLVLSLVALASAFHHHDPDAPLETDEIIQAVNNANTTWKAGRNFDPTLKKSYLKFLLGLKERPEGIQRPPPLEDDEDEYLELPESFDAREKWSHCISLQEVRDQGPCGSCWAVSAAAALTDRFCIATGGKFNGHLSAQDLLSCCEYCGLGCHGGSDDLAWQYFQDIGICTGGDYQSEEGCQPYLLPACEHHVSGPRKNCSAYNHGHMLPTPECQNSCYNKKYKDHPKKKDLYKVKSFFSIPGIKKIQKEIFKHGPVQAGFGVYEDFLSYKSGVYHHESGDSLPEGHAVKVIGWGTEDGTDYWLAANSWNSDWGDKGFFKIRRGNNECGFEKEVKAGYPDV